MTFFSEAWNRYLYPQALGRAVLKRKMDAAQDFVFLPKKKNQKSFTNKKNTLSQSAESYFFFTTEAAEVKRTGGNEKIARFDRSVRSSVKWNILEQGFDRARLCFLCSTHCFNDLICYLSDLPLPNGFRKFSENKANRMEKHDHFSLQKCCWVIIYSANL